MNEVINKVVELNLNDILPNRYQPRIQFNDQDIIELSESIKEHGVIQPIVVRPLGNKYEIIAGERRYKASVFAGKQTIPALIININDKQTVEIALIENIQRKDLTPIEEAISYKRILDMGHTTQEQLATKLGKSQPSIANKLRLLNLSDEVQEALLKNQISERHARSLLKLQNKQAQKELLKKIIDERLTVKRTDEEIDKMNNNEFNNNINNNQMNINSGMTSQQPSLTPNQQSENVFEPINSVQPTIGLKDIVMNNPQPVDNSVVQPVEPIMNNPIGIQPEPIIANEPINFGPQFDNNPVLQNDMEMISIGSLFNNIPPQPVDNSVVQPVESAPAPMEAPFQQNILPEQPISPTTNKNDSLAGMFNFNQAPTSVEPIIPTPVDNGVVMPVEQPTIGLKDLVNNNTQQSVTNNQIFSQETMMEPQSNSEPTVQNQELSTTPFMFNNQDNSMFQPMSEINSFEVEAPINPMDTMPQTPIMPPIPEDIPSNPIIDNSAMSVEQPAEMIQQPMQQSVVQNQVPTPQTVEAKMPEPIIITDYNKQYDPVMPQVNQPVEPTISFKQVIDLIRNCSKSIEQYGYKIDTDEFDLQDSYQVIFKIEKE